MTTKQKRPPATLSVDDLSGLAPARAFEDQIRFVAQIERWNRDPQLVAALGHALTARDVEREAQTTLSKAADESGMTLLHKLDDAKYCSHFPSETVNRLRDLRLAASRLTNTRKAAVAALTAQVDAALASPEVREAAVEQIDEAGALTRQARAAMDAAEQRLDAVLSALDARSPRVSQVQNGLLGVRMERRDRVDWLAKYCAAAGELLAAEDQEASA